MFNRRGQRFARVVWIGIASIWFWPVAHGPLYAKDEVLTGVAGMVRIHGGCFKFGPVDSSQSGAEICLPDYFIDKAEVTVAQYAKCVKAGACHSMRQVGETREQRAQQQGDFPVGGLLWEDADSYCRWAGKRLPTRHEWERAARGPKMWRYPWGNSSPKATQATCQKTSDPSYGLRKVCTKPAGNSAEGVCDMADNLPEYVDGWLDHSGEVRIREGAPPPEETAVAVRIVMPGGAECGVPVEPWNLIAAWPDRMRSSYYGFRCAKTLSAPNP